MEEADCGRRATRPNLEVTGRTFPTLLFFILLLLYVFPLPRRVFTDGIGGGAWDECSKLEEEEEEVKAAPAMAVAEERELEQG